MAHPLARVRNGFLEDPGGDETRAAAVPVGSAAWYNWLTQHRSFRFEHRRTPYTARREQRPGGWYWYASHRTKGTLHTLYLGRSEDLTLERLEAVAQRFAQAPLQPSRAEDLATGRVGMPPDLLLATKLTPPQPRPTLVSRPRLISRIQEGTRGKLTLIVAPAGYGKTTLLGAWMTSGALPVAWLSLDEGDNDSTRFWSYVVAALERRRPGFSEHLVPLIRAPQVPPMEVLLTTLINALAAIPKDVALILDDYHLIQAAPIHSAMTFLLEHLPPQVHLVLASRAEPPLALARVRAQGEVTEVHLADLRFTPDEVASFLQRGTGLALSLTQIGQLAARTEGWIAGLQLAALSMQQCDNVATFIETFAGDDRHIFDYFTEEVLQGQPEHLQAFLLQTSILDRLTGSLCDAVTGKPGSAATLRALEQANLFIVPMDTQRCWYRYHPLFADLLRHRLHQGEASLVETLHRRAAAWYAQQGLSHEAVQHALAAADFALAAHLIEELATTTLRVGLAATMLTWLEALPADLVHTRPRLGLLYAQAYLELSQFAAAEPGVRDAEAALSACSDLPADEQRTLLGRVEAIRSTIAINLGDIPGVLAHAHRALDLLSADDEQSRIEIAQVLLNLADANAAGDDPAAVQVMYAKAIALNRQAANFATTITAMSGLGRVQTLQGQLHKAAHTLREAIALATEGGGPFHGLLQAQRTSFSAHCALSGTTWMEPRIT